MSGLAHSVESVLANIVKAHTVHASFPADRFFNKLAFMTVILQSLAIIIANWTAGQKITCSSDSTPSLTNASGLTKSSAVAYAESYCYSRGVDQRNVPNHTIPASFHGVLNHYILQFYLPFLFLMEAVMLYLPYYVWSNTVGEDLRQQVQFVVDLSKKLLQDSASADEDDPNHVHKESCKHRRFQEGRATLDDVLTESGLKMRLRRWYCKPKHTNYYYFLQVGRIVMIISWISFFLFFPGFRRNDIRYDFLCVLEGNERYQCVLLQASLFQVGWTSNMTLLVFCLALIVQQIVYKFPFVYSCRCITCKTKRCLRSCRKDCKSHYFQRILGITIQPKRNTEGQHCCGLIKSRRSPEYDDLGSTDYYSPRLVDRYYISQLCYENAHLLHGILPDPTSANKSEEFSSFGNLASMAMTLDKKADAVQDDLSSAASKAEEKSKNLIAGKLQPFKKAAMNTVQTSENISEKLETDAKNMSDLASDEAKTVGGKLQPFRKAAMNTDQAVEGASQNIETGTKSMQKIESEK